VRGKTPPREAVSSGLERQTNSRTRPPLASRRMSGSPSHRTNPLQNLRGWRDDVRNTPLPSGAGSSQCTRSTRVCRFPISRICIALLVARRRPEMSPAVCGPGLPLRGWKRQPRRECRLVTKQDSDDGSVSRLRPNRPISGPERAGSAKRSDGPASRITICGRSHALTGGRRRSGERRCGRSVVSGPAGICEQQSQRLSRRNTSRRAAPWCWGSW
jgi:hypothetical protein